ncbi:helix-turn-helix transcriptional regulator [Paenibacillus campi]|uniref:helix-turn-helix domain-containing protein n=1 Tax=Paenibacillus campi TaxID=3106031 RepID=UPI002AFE10F9|nr:helix-turn-helix transcriptional regulator [Paenibacillus sp. SGZ-1014]
MTTGIKRRHAPYQKFKSFLVENGIKQKEIAKILNKSQTAFNQNLNGTGGDFSVMEIRKICTALQISGDEYFLNLHVSKTKHNEGVTNIGSADDSPHS